MIELHNVDCMEYLRTCEDNAFELAIVDPPYGIGDFWKGGDASKLKRINEIRKSEKSWNNETPSLEYWNEMKRVSVNFIAWGWNYYTEHLGSSDSLIYWYKKMGAPNYSDGEIAFTTFKHKIKTYYLHPSNGMDGRTHPCQKPVKLYEWLLINYAKEGDRILDTHLGSGSIAIACHNLGFDLVGCELDTDYFEAAQKRLEQHQSQLRIPMQ
tara:strand:- start:198 stop:830 length:633 start_codon:yes stop_codon:yes gene_type:complete